MPVGHGIIDYIVIVAVTVATLLLLSRQQERLLLFLPLFLTIDFFIPLAGTQFGPSRLLPLILGAWLFYKGWLVPERRYAPVVFLAVATLILASGYAFFVGDAGRRPYLRLLHYLSLIFVFLFVTKVIKRPRFIELALWGVFFAGVIHGLHAIYQIAADSLNLPYRGIVYDASGATVPVRAGDLLRVNGLADEPKRLGYILFCSAIVGYYFVSRNDRRQMYLPLGAWSGVFKSTFVLILTITALSILSLLTFSGSYMLSVFITGVLLILTFSRRVFPVALIVSVLLPIFVMFYPNVAKNYVDAAFALADDRFVEFQLGLDANKVYRQEFFAEAYVSDHPSTLIYGVGLGRYNQVLSDEYGIGAGLDQRGGLLPLNSQFFEVMMDLGAPGLIVIYVITLLIVQRLGRRRNSDFCLSTMLLFLVAQSIFIDNKFLLVFILGAALSQLLIRNIDRKRGARYRRRTTFLPHVSSARRFDRG